jgi:hypothetical protein
MVEVIYCEVLCVGRRAPSKQYYAMCEQMLVGSASTIYPAVATLTYLYRHISFITVTKASSIGHIEFKIGVPLPTLNREMNIKH